MSALIAKLDRLLTGDNPVADFKLQPEHWEELRPILEDGIRFRWLRDASGCSIEIPVGKGWLEFFSGNSLDAAIDQARNNTTKEPK